MSEQKIEQPDGIQGALKAGNLVITSAVNDCPVDAKALATMQNLAKRNKAQLVVIKQHYRNPTSPWEKQENEGKTWDPAIADYTLGRDLDSGKVRILGSMRVQATSPNPLMGKSIFSHMPVSIVGAARQHLDSVPRIPQEDPRYTLTTGSCTAPQYSHTDAGVRAEDNHILGCVLVKQARNGKAEVRQLSYNCRLEGIYDVDGFYGADGTFKKESIDTLVLGDVHIETQSKEAAKAAMAQVKKYKPTYTMLHDLVSVAIHNPHTKVGMMEHFEAVACDSVSSLGECIDMGAEFVRKLAKHTNPVMVPSNHDLMLKRWVLDQSWQSSYYDVDLYLETAQIISDQIREGQRLKNISPMADIIEYRADVENFKALKFGETFTRHGVTLHLHGHAGINGARGSVVSFAKSAHKVIHGHTHSPMRRDGAMSVGTMEDITENSYTCDSGMTSWAYVNAALFADGKRTLLLEI